MTCRRTLLRAAAAGLAGLALGARGQSRGRLPVVGFLSPQRRRVAVLWDATTGRAQLAAAEGAARRLGVDLQVLEFGSGNDLDRVLRGASGGKAQAMLLLSSPLVSVNSRPIAEFAAQHRLPAISPFRAFADAGGLMSYGPDLVAFRRFAATYVSRILKGARPADLPIQQPSNFLFVVNQRAAAALGLSLPQSLLVSADEVIA